MLRTALVGFVFVLSALVDVTARQDASGANPSRHQYNAAAVPVPRSAQYPLTSKINGRTYRIMVSTPFMFDPAIAYPVLYVLDGNVFFGTVSETAHFQSFGKVIAPAIVVAIAYDTDDLNEWVRLRRFDLTPTPSPKPDDAAPAGGGDAFLRVIQDEVKPLIRSRYKIDESRQTLFGMSFGGLAALRSLFRNPGAFSTYIVASPSIWWDNKAVLVDEAAFSKRIRSGELALSVMLTSARDEQYHGHDPKLLAEAQSGSRMVDNASELAARLTALNSDKLRIARVIFDDEIHNTVPAAAISRGLRFALPLK
jgi:predicted alpha/beta superfamily hydrolase